jgi:pilus assembly protein CpaE
MSTAASVLILTSETDKNLREEITTAMRALGDDEPRFRFVADHNQLFEALRTQPIDLVLAEFTSQPKELTSLVRQIATSSPTTAVAAILRPEGFAENVSESAVLIDAMRCGVCDFLRRPISTSDLRRLLQKRADSSLATPGRVPTMGRVVSFISNKGGVGKSTLATNVAVAVARRQNQRVLLIDGSLQMGVGAALLDLRPTATLTDLARESDRLDATMIRQSTAVHSSGLHLLAAPADAVEAMEIDDVLMARIITLARQTYDVVIIDTFPMFDRVVIAALDLSDRVYVVLENVVPTLLGGVKLLEVLERIGFPADRQSIIVNRYQRIAGSLSITEVAERMGRPIEHLLPFDKRVIAAANSGQPIALSPLRFSGFSRSLERLATEVAGQSASAERRSATTRVEPAGVMKS